MPGKTAIEWATKVWNPVSGCTKVSPGCLNCYAETIDKRFHMYRTGEPFVPWTVKAQQGVGRSAVTEHPDRLSVPLKWPAKTPPERIFVASVSDPLHEEVSDYFLARMFGTMVATPWHYYLFLTKRTTEADKAKVDILNCPMFVNEVAVYAQHDAPVLPWPPKNVCFISSVENQRYAGERHDVMELMHLQGWQTGVSYEPALEIVDWSGWEFIDWMVAGGESGHGARPVHPDAFRQARDWCLEWQIPYFLKQWGEWVTVTNFTPDTVPQGKALHWFDGPGVADHPLQSRWVDGMVKVGKKAAGAVLDGREWRECPKGCEKIA